MGEELAQYDHAGERIPRPGLAVVGQGRTAREVDDLNQPHQMSPRPVTL